MTTVKQISYLKLLVRDLDAALMWYTEKLGFELRADYSMGQAGRWGVIWLRSQPDLSVALECPSMEVFIGDACMAQPPIRSDCRAPQPLRPGSAGDVQQRPSPVGSEVLDMWKWRLPLFLRGCCTSFPGDPVEVPEVQGNGYFQIFKAI